MKNEIFNKASEIKEVSQTIVENFRGIKPRSDFSLSDAKAFSAELYGGVSYEERWDRTPKKDSKDGSWSGDRGESMFVPSDATEHGKAAKEKLKEYGLKGIKYKDAEPDFSPCSEATVTIDKMTESRPSNFNQAAVKCAEQWNSIRRDGKSDWTAGDVRDYRQNNKLSWHERRDMKTMDLVPQEIHEVCIHSGGVAECKAHDPNHRGGNFDE